MTENTTLDEFDDIIDNLIQSAERYYNPILVVLGLLGNCISIVWLVVAFTVERYIAVKWPLRRRFLCTVVRAKMTVMGLMALAILLNSPILFFSKLNKTNKNSTSCGLTDEYLKSWYPTFNIFDTILTFIVPLTMIVIFNTLIARNIYKLDNVRRTLTIESDVSNDRTYTSRDRMPQTKVTKMLLVVSTAFFCLNMPSVVTRILSLSFIFIYTQREILWLRRAQHISQLLFSTSFGINFILYCVSGQNFRREIVRMCGKRSSTERSGTLMQMTSHEKQCDRHLITRL
ncbi:thyrotropin-releasing hormone receptor isoform X2 [Monomorium pharaonis]|uniref:thyrotropin-releasing hormone receptor isoform X2 n=1 Tax=Monomorium pharaonis TaxID=307658 RepID=UPI00063F2634|nr:thyrotropin-releasing hormone receptor isoform X2 [Monomorium pharaonis]